MNDCYKKKYLDYDWLIFYEIDEYIYLYDYENIKYFLNQSKFDNSQEIYLNLVCHTNNNLLYYEDKPLAQRFPKFVPETKNYGKMFEMKSIIRGKIRGVKITNNNLGDPSLKNCNSSWLKEKLYIHYTFNGDKRTLLY